MPFSAIESCARSQAGSREFLSYRRYTNAESDRHAHAVHLLATTNLP